MEEIKPPVSHTHTNREVEEGTGRPGCRSKYWASEVRRDELHVTRQVVRDEFKTTHGDQRDELGKMRNNAAASVKIRLRQRDESRKIREVRDDGFVQESKRKTCKHWKRRMERLVRVGSTSATF